MVMVLATVILRTVVVMKVTSQGVGVLSLPLEKTIPRVSVLICPERTDR